MNASSFTSAPRTAKQHASVAQRGTSGKERSPGFTLVELLVVIALLAVLAAILVPVLAGARRRAWQATCLSNLRQIGQAQLLYLQDHDDQFPHWFTPAPPRPAPFGQYSIWTEYFQPYLHSQAILRDPGARWSRAFPREEQLAEYALATWGRSSRGTRENPHWRWPGPPLSLANVVRPAETLTVMDGWTTPRWTALDLGRHHGGMNATFVDGHARWLTAAEFWRVDTDGRGSYWIRYASADR